MELLAWILALNSAAMEPDLSDVPGVVIDYRPASSGLYLGSPSIAKLGPGHYVASHDLFGPASTEHEQAIVQVFETRDDGATWSHLSDIHGQFWSGLFVRQGALYILGTYSHYGPLIIRRSDDGGRTWTEPDTPETGLLLDDARYHTAPMPVIEHDGRLWRAVERIDGDGWGMGFRPLLISAPLDADLLKAASWTVAEGPMPSADWLGGKFNGWLEGNAVVTPGGKLANVMRVDYRPEGGIAAMLILGEDGRLHFDPETGFIEFPGGCKKFNIRKHPGTDAYWSLSNYIPEKHAGKNPERTRNTVALVRSEDLRQWTVERIVLYHPDVDKHGFQYLDWRFEDGRITAVSRTAYHDGLGGAHNQHDANLMTFHRFELP